MGNIKKYVEIKIKRILWGTASIYLNVKTITFWLVISEVQTSYFFGKVKPSHIEYYFKKYPIPLKAPETSL